MKPLKFKTMKIQNGNQQRTAVTLLSCALVTGCSGIGGSEILPTGGSVDEERLRTPTIYVGIGAGVSQLEPDTSETDEEVSDNNDTGGQITLGVDASKHISFELHYTQLGSAEISPAGSISYDVLGGSALIYAGKNRDNFKRRGLLAYGRIGYGLLDNSAQGGVNFEQENEGHLLLGAGLEYMTRSGIGVRGEAIAFDEDALYAQLGLVYRFGKQRGASVAAVVEEPTLADPSEEVEATPAPLVPVPEADLAENPELDASDACGQLTGVLEGINFEWNSDTLTSESEAALEEIASTLNECDNSVQILAHTDSQGPADYNLDLSSRRARSVARILIQQGVDLSRLEALAFGETQPIDTNETSEGRSRNRRVELVVE